VPVADRHLDYAEQVEAGLRRRGVRVRVDGRSESVGKKVHDAEEAKVPYMLVVGDRELEAAQVSVRSHGDGELGAMSVEELAQRIVPGDIP
jgi:threonyl-tRNA synthetase